jgi:acyl carrier protein
MDIQNEVLAILNDVLSLKGRSRSFTNDTALLGAIPELDSMAVVALITSMEERFGFIVGDDEIDGSAFATVDTLTDFVQGKLNRRSSYT